MANFHIHFDLDDKELRQAIRRAPERMIQGINTSLRRSAVFGVRQYRMNMPAGATGELRRSANFHFNSKVEVKVEPTAPQAEWVEKGTRPHWTSVKNLERWANLKGINPYALQRSIAKHGTRAQPFQEKTYNQVDQFAGNDMRIELERKMREIL